MIYYSQSAAITYESMVGLKTTEITVKMTIFKFNQVSKKSLFKYFTFRCQKSSYSYRSITL